MHDQLADGRSYRLFNVINEVSLDRFAATMGRKT